MFSRFFRRHERRDIFAYWDGQSQRQIDPLVAWRALWEDPDVDPKLDFQLATGLDEQGRAVDYDPAAQDRVAALVRKIFDVQPWSEKTAGLTVNETFQLLWSFLRYINELKKKRGPTPTSSPPTESRPSDGDSITPPESASSSIRNESTSDAPPPSSKRSVVL